MKKSFMRRWVKEPGNKALAEGVQYYGQKICDLINERGGEDLPLILAAFKSSLPALEAHLSEVDKQLVDGLVEATITIDASPIDGMVTGHD